MSDDMTNAPPPPNTLPPLNATPPPPPTPLGLPTPEGPRPRSRAIVIAVVVGVVVLLGACLAATLLVFVPFFEVVIGDGAPPSYDYVTDGPAPDDGPAVLGDYEQASLDALDAMWADPTDVEKVAAVGNAYFDWAVALTEQGELEEADEKWALAVTYYDQALSLKPDNDPVLGDRAFALYALDDPRAAAALEKFIAAAEDNPQYTSQVQAAKDDLATLK